MSGSIPGPDKQEPSSIDLQLIEALQSDDPNVVARATQRLAQNDPRYSEPQMPQTTTPGAAGIREEDLGLGGKSMFDIDRLDEERRRYGVSSAQQATDAKATATDVYTGGDTPEALAKAAWLALVNPDAIAGRSFGPQEAMTAEERREKEQKEQAFIQFMDDMFHDLGQAMNYFAQEQEENRQNLEQAEAETADTLALIQQDLIAAAQSVNEQAEKLDALKKQAEAETDPDKKAALQAQINAAQQEYDNSMKLYLANAEAYGHLNGKQNEAREQFNATQAKMDELNKQLSGATDEQEKARIREQLAELKILQDQNERKIQELRATAQTMRDVMLAGKEQGGLSYEKAQELALRTRDDAELAGVVTKLTGAMMASGMYITDSQGNQQKSEHGSALMQIEMLDVQSAKLKEQLTGDIVADEETNKKLTELAQQRLALENSMGMCVVNKPEWNAYLAAQEAQPKDGPFVMKDTSGSVLTNFSVGLAAGALTLTAFGGKTYKFDELSAEDKRMVVDALKEGLADGQKLEPEVIAALKATEGVNMSVETIANNPPQPAPAEVVAAPAAPAPTVDPVLAKQQQAQAAQQEEMRLTAAAAESARVEQERLEKGAVERMMAGGSMSAEEFERMKRILGSSYAEQLAEEHKVKVEKGILAEMGLGMLKPGATVFGSFLFAGMAAQMAGREISSWQPQTPMSGILGGGYSSFADSIDFTSYNDPSQIDPSYSQQSSYASLAGLATMFGLGGPTSTQQQIQVQQPGAAAPSPAEQYRMQQELLARMGLTSGPTPPSSNSQQQV